MLNRTIVSLQWLGLVAALALTAGCTPADEEPLLDEEDGSLAVEDPVLEDVSVLLEGAPSNDELPEIGKADQELPKRFTDVIETQSSVKSQGSRGVCSIFSTAAYMEHLYIAEGTIQSPDFSEQYLQWSAKFEVGSFPNTGGSSASYNLQAISEYGIPEESAWPYEPRQWGASEDPECSGDDVPTRCYTNGAPPEEALAAQKYYLPNSRYISTRTRDLKSHIFNTGTGVVVGMTFFYQSWNHSRSQLPRNMDYWNEGYVLYPNAKDKEISLVKRAGHSILLLGWDDELEVPIRDENGDVMTDESGEPLVERGFFLFKNSWGTGSFGSANELGDGYGWLSYRYVQEYGSARVAGLPDLERDPEICGDGVDNDGNFAVDCDDDACSADALCTSSTQIIEVELPTGGLAIPDNDPTGATSTFEVVEDATIEALKVTVDIEHTFRGDLSVRLVHPDGTVAELQSNSWDSDSNLQETYVVDAFTGKPSAGTWELIIADHGAVDTGTLRAATVEMAR